MSCGVAAPYTLLPEPVSLPPAEPVGTAPPIDPPGPPVIDPEGMPMLPLSIMLPFGALPPGDVPFALFDPPLALWLEDKKCE